METTTQLVIIGSGPGGYVAAIRAAQLKIDTILIEENEIGGTCLNKGCIPTKAFLHTASTFRELKHSSYMGIHIEQSHVDMNEMYDYKNQIVETMSSGVRQLLEANHVRIINGRARIIGEDQVFVLNKDGSQETVTAENILIATGAVPQIPPIKGSDLQGVYTSNELLEDKFPDFKSLVIIGGGVIGVEFAEVFSALSIPVTIIEAANSLLPAMDTDISQNLGLLFRKKGIKVHTDSVVKEIQKSNENELKLIFEAKGKLQEIEAEGILIATGRKANTENLFSDQIRPEMERDRLLVDEKFRTSIPHIYAIGDVTNQIQLAHLASAQGKAAAEIIAGRMVKTSFKFVPACVYTSPEIASVGRTKRQCEEQNIPYRVGKILLNSNGKAMISKEERSFIKLIFQEENHRLLGVSLMCARASDLIGEFTTALANDLNLEQLEKSIRAHPTFGEAIGEALEELHEGAIHGIPKKK